MEEEVVEKCENLNYCGEIIHMHRRCCHFHINSGMVDSSSISFVSYRCNELRTHGANALKGTFLAFKHVKPTGKKKLEKACIPRVVDIGYREYRDGTWCIKTTGEFEDFTPSMQRMATGG